MYLLTQDAFLSIKELVVKIESIFCLGIRDTGRESEVKDLAIDEIPCQLSVVKYYMRGCALEELMLAYTRERASREGRRGEKYTTWFKRISPACTN